MGEKIPIRAVKHPRIEPKTKAADGLPGIANSAMDVGLSRARGKTSAMPPC